MHQTEQKFPEQCKRFKEITDGLYSLHLAKNSDYCVSPDTKILKSSFEWVAASRLVVGDRLIGFSEVNGGVKSKRKYRESIVEDVSPVELPSYKLTLLDGTVLISSSEHPWLVMTGCTARWLETERLQSKENFRNPSRLVKLFDLWEYDASRDGGYLAAAFDGEGWLTHKENPSNTQKNRDNWIFTAGFSQNENLMLAEVERILRSRGIRFRKRFGKNKKLHQVILTKRNQLVQLFGSIRPHRLLPKILPTMGRIKHVPVDLQKKEKIGRVELVSIKTNTKTYIANGFASHNSPYNILATGGVGSLTRIWDKTARLMSLGGFDIGTGEYRGAKEASNESVEDTLRDLANYAIIELVRRDGKWGK